MKFYNYISVALESSTMLTGTDNNKPTSETTLLSSGENTFVFFIFSPC